MAHGQWTEVEARGVLEAWKKSGASLETFARSRGLVPQRLYWCRVAPGIAPRGSHRSGRAQLRHPALQVTGSLLVA